MVWFFLVRRISGAQAGAALNLGRNKVKIYDRKEMKTTFADVAGVDEAKEELKEIVEFLRNPKKYQRLGGRIPKGVLLLGPPGCGKTLLARAVAGEANVPFFFMSGSEFVEMFVGLGAARVRELFQQAKEKAPALVFLDEIDTIGKGRAGALGAGFGAHDEREQTLNQLLVEMDGFDSQKGVIIMAATNRPDVLDPALVRPGRFDRQVVVDQPDLRGREEILKVHVRGVALDRHVDLRVLASRTPGFTGADLANVVNEAALLAARREREAVTMVELEEAIDRTVAGLERKSRVMSVKDKERVAIHEMGHALVALTAETADPVHRVSIIPRGAAALGMTMQRPLEDRYLLTEPELKDRLAVLLGGRTAEEILFDQVVSTGAQNDLERATEISRAMVTEYGMSPKIGPVSFGHDGFRPGAGFLYPGGSPELSDDLAALIDEETARLVNEAHDRATEVLTRYRGLLEQLSKILIVNEVIDGPDLQAYFDGSKPIPTPEELEAKIHAERPRGGGRLEGAGHRPAAWPLLTVVRRPNEQVVAVPEPLEEPVVVALGEPVAFGLGGRVVHPVLVPDDRRVDTQGAQAGVLDPERVVDVGRPVPAEPLVEQPDVADHVPAERHQVPLDRVDLGSVALVELTQVLGRDPERPADADARVFERGLERREHVPRRFDRSVHHEHGPATRTFEPGVQGGAPSRPGLEREDLDLLPVGRGLRVGDVRDDVAHVAASTVRAQACQRPPDVLGPTLDDPMDAHVGGRRLVEQALDVVRGDAVGFGDCQRLERRAIRAVDHREAEPCDPIAERVRGGEVLGPPARVAFGRERANLVGDLGHGLRPCGWTRRAPSRPSGGALPRPPAS